MSAASYAFATCTAPRRSRDDDDRLVALTGATWHDWDDPSVDWASFDLVVVRSTWDYTGRREEFLAWARSVPRIVNPPEVLEANTDKLYLAEAQEAGLAIVPTTFLGPGERFAAPRGGRYVVKPSVSAGAQDTVVFEEGDAEAARAARLVDAIHESGRTAMVQPHVASVDVRGETGVYFFGGDYSHAIGKGAVLKPGMEVEY